MSATSTPSRGRRWIAAVPTLVRRVTPGEAEPAATRPPPAPAHQDAAPPQPMPSWAQSCPPQDPAPAQAPKLRARTTADLRPKAPPKARPAPALRPGDERFLDSVREAQLAEVSTRTRAALWLMVLTVALATAWAAFTQVEQITRAEARVVPDGREQVIASLEGGLLREMLVREGERVRAGQPLLRLDPTRVNSQQAEGQVKRLALLASLARLQAEATGQALRFPPELTQAPTLTATETEAYQARRKLLQEAAGATAHGVALVQKELDVAASMARQGLMSEVEVMRLRRQIIDLQQQSLERQNRFRQDASTELLRLKSELAQLDEQMVAREDAVKRTEIASPVDGVVKNIRHATLGGVVAGGAPILEIVPQGAQLRVEARIKPADIGFIHVGQAAEVKLSAYEFNLYGGLHGRVERISPDALGEADKPPGSADATWYRALISVERSTLKAQGEALPVIPGMTGTVEINTGERSVLAYLFRPLLKAREAFTER